MCSIKPTSHRPIFQESDGMRVTEHNLMQFDTLSSQIPSDSNHFFKTPLSNWSHRIFVPFIPCAVIKIDNHMRSIWLSLTCRTPSDSSKVNIIICLSPRSTDRFFIWFPVRFVKPSNNQAMGCRLQTAMTAINFTIVKSLSILFQHIIMIFLEGLNSQLIYNGDLPLSKIVTI